MHLTIRRPVSAALVAALMLATASVSPVLAQDAAPAPTTAPAPAASPVDPQAVVATVNGVDVTEADLDLALADLDQQFQQLPVEQRRAAALSALIEIRLLAQESEKAGVADGDEFQRRMAFLRNRALHSAFVEDRVAGAITDEAVRARYDQEVASTPPTNEIRAAHILVSTEEEAKAIIEQLDGGADFAELAKEKSSDGAAQNGGDLGYFAEGRMVPEFEQAAFAMEVGAHSAQPVQTQFGWHVIKVGDKRAQQPPAFEQVSQQIRSIMVRDKYMEEVAAIRDAADVEITDAALKEALEPATTPDAAPANGETAPQQ